MALISLRAYNREIEGMIENGQLDEAVAHCRHILATFPKHIATYRLLGKAHLEQQRISDATDIFQRVLTAIPDDFISNVGMSIIREDENNLDAAIWHMELAYEAQPANIAIQDEFRRLYGRRDGVQPSKVRLTRGALARMYAKGGLYDQAIAELRAAISEDPNRPDLQQLIAQMFYQTSQRVEAVETCVNIIKKLPMCLEANRILAVSLPETEGSDAVKNYRQIVISMDPYYAFAEADAISSDEVPENAVNIERLEWKSGIQIGETPNQPAWATSLGISMDKPTEEKIPDWLKSAEAPAPGSVDKKASPNVSPFIWNTQEVEKIITDTSKPEGDIPDWMKDAGWKPATGETTPPTEETKPEEPIAEASASDDLEKANLPEWLRGIAPEGAFGAEKQDVLPKEDNLSNPWLEPHQPGPTDSVIQWLEEKKPGSPTTPPTKADDLAMGIEEEVPDWLKGLDLPQTTPAQEGKPSETVPAFASEPSDFIEETAKPESDTAEAGVTSGEGAVMPAVEAQTAQTETGLPPEVSESKASSADSVDEIPDWLKEIANEMPSTEPFISAVKKSTAETSLNTGPELINEQPLTSGEAPREELPAALEKTTEQTSPELAEALPESQVPAVAVELPTAEVAPTPEEVPTTELPVVAESLPLTETPVTTEYQPSAEVESTSEQIPPPEQPMVTEALPKVEQPGIAEILPTVEMPSISEEVPTTIPTITEGEVPSQELPKTVASLPEAEIPAVPEELRTVEVASISEEVPTTEPLTSAEELPAIETPTAVEAQPQAEQPLPEEAELAPAQPAPTSESNEFAWLEGLVGEQAAKEEELIKPSPEGEIAPPEWVKLESEPSMEKTEEPEPKASVETPAVPAEEIPEWIKGLGEEPKIEPTPKVPVQSVPSETEALKTEELPAWLHEMEQPTKEIKPSISPTGALEWKEDKLPAWLKEIGASEEPEKIPAATEVHRADEIPVPVVEPTPEPTEEIATTPVETGEKALEEPAEETKPSISPMGALEWKEGKLPAWLKDIAASEEPEKGPIAMEVHPAEEIPVPVVEPTPETTEEIATTPVETGEKALEEPAEETKPSISPTGALEWKEGKLPAWLKDIAASEEPEKGPIAMEVHPAEEIPVPVVEPTPEPTEEMATTQVETGEKALEEPAEETKPPISPTGALAWKEEELPAWLKDIASSEESEKVPAEMEVHPAEEIPVPVVEPTPEPTEEIVSPPVETGEKALEEPAEETKPPISPTGALAWKEEELPAWLKEITETSPAEEAAATIEASPEETPATLVEPTSEPTEEIVSAPVETGEKALEEPVEQTKPPISPTGALAWKEEELPAWLKEITETSPAEEAAAVIEAPPEETPATLVEPTPEPTEEIVSAPVETGEKALVETPTETGPWVPEVEEPVQPVSAIPAEAVAEPVPVMEELTTKAVEITPTTPPKQPAVPVEMESEVDRSALADARNAISQGQPAQAAGFYTGLIKQNYHLDEIIKDLQDALYRFPVDVDLWVTLGDAQYRSDDLQEALNAYTKAEELVR